MKNAEQARLNDINEEVFKWRGGFIGSNHAMSNISNILSSKYVEASCVKIIRADGECVELESAVIKYTTT